MGRDRKNELRTDHYTMMVRNLMQTEAWRALGSIAQTLYPWIRLEWRGKNANNNGKLRLSVRQAAALMGCGKNASAQAFIDLQKKGFLVVTEAATLGISGEAKSSAYELTEISLPNNLSGRKLYHSWREGGDFPVIKTLTNNPTGRNGKIKPCPRNQDSPVIEIGMFKQNLSPEAGRPVPRRGTK
ncbi:hypothetical protein [Tabrizicola sp.]|uniref:hypothetical protein n=1 Tax=Tabrizicola sp. TaxID=2005166 RepID=UPI0025D7640A|nr:hypothetical protein [Tabrizicola sp.]